MGVTSTRPPVDSPGSTVTKAGGAVRLFHLHPGRAVGGGRQRGGGHHEDSPVRAAHRDDDLHVGAHEMLGHVLGDDLHVVAVGGHAP